MSKPLLAILAFVCTLPLTTSAAGLDDVPEYATAHQALSDGLPGVAAVKAERLLKRHDWSRADLRRLATFAAEAWTRAQDGQAVLTLVEAYDLEDETFWHAQALTLLGNLPAARRILTERDLSPREPRAALLLGQILSTLGETGTARAEIEPLISSTDPQLARQARLLLEEINLDERTPAQPAADISGTDAGANYLRARALLQSGKTAPAKAALDLVLDASGGGERLRHAAILLQGEILIREKRPDAAHDHLTRFLDNTPESSLWTEAFDLLDRAHAALPQPALLPDSVLRWMFSGNTAQQTPAPTAASARATAEFCGHAVYVVARWLAAQKRDAEAVSLLEALIQMHPAHPRLAASMRMAMEIHAAQGADARVLSLADAWRQRFDDASASVDAMAGGVFFRRGEHWNALQSFQNAANLAVTLSDRRTALFNAALTAVLAGNLGLYQSLLGQLDLATSSSATTQDRPDSAATLELEKALFLASGHKQGAEESLRAFIRAHPSHPRFADACVALAEWMLMATPPRAEDARTTLDAATTSAALTVEQRQRLECTRLWLNEATGDLAALITGGTTFLKTWPKSQLVPEVRLRIATAHYRLEDFASARTEFEIIARDYPGTPHAETALYFAAMSASSVMSPEGRERALAIWEELAAKGGELAVAARRQQALSERAQGRLPQAVAALEKLLALKGLESEQRRMATCEKAEVLLLLGKTEPARLDVAAALLDDFLADITLPMFWKARAGFTLATVHHDAGRDTEALEACYNILRAADISPPSSPADYVWFAKAGFFGIDLLEAARQWEPAARLAEQIAQLPGNRAAEARERATKVRLEHFLWDGPAPTPPKELKFEDKGDPPASPRPTAKGGSKKQG